MLRRFCHPNFSSVTLLAIHRLDLRPCDGKLYRSDQCVRRAAPAQGFLIETIRRHQNCYRLADDLLGGIAEYSLGTGIPTCDDAFQVLCHYRIARKLDEGGKMGGCDLSLSTSC